MQLLTLAGLFIIIYSVAAQGAEKIGPCEQARREAGKPLPGRFIPKCTKYGYYEPAQCHGSTGKCYCVNPDDGTQIKGSETFRTGAPECTICLVKRSQALGPFLGAYAPTCDADGLFETTQRHGSTGQSWCVNKYTGEEIPNSRVAPGQERKTPCSIYAHLAGLTMHSLLEQKGPCYAQILESRGRESTPGFFTPGCTDNGYYRTEQHHSSTGFSWCVNPETGKEIPNTRRGPTEQKSECGVCFKEIEKKLSRKPVFGNHLPQCNKENGDYVPEQHVEGYSFCVNPKTGTVEGKKYPPGDNTPLPCVNH